MPESSTEGLLALSVAQLAADSAERPFDCVIVGGGSTGLTAARTLIEESPELRVAVIEGGPAPFLTHIGNTELRFAPGLLRNVRDQVRYGPSLPDGTPFGPNYGCLGGRGLFWNGAAPRFRDHDFTGWPLSASDLEEDFRWAEKQFRVTRRLGESDLASRMIDALRGAGVDAQSGPFAADSGSLEPGVLGAGIASGLGIFFRGAGTAVVEGRIRVATRTTAQEVLHCNGQVRGVRAVSAGASAEIVAARSVVLAGGGIESIRLAQLSRVSDDSGLLGFGIQEHHFYDCWFDAPHLFHDASPDTAVVYAPSASQDAEQWELHAPGGSLFVLDDGEPWCPKPSQRYRIMVRSFCATDKQADNLVKSRKGPRGKATVRFSYTDTDRRRREAILDNAVRIQNALGMEPVDTLPVDSLERFRGPGSSYHEAGGLDMGNDPATSVTDLDGRFHRLPGLVCADAAALPRIGATNPHLTLVALARRKARVLAGCLRR